MKETDRHCLHCCFTLIVDQYDPITIVQPKLLSVICVVVWCCAPPY